MDLHRYFTTARIEANKSEYYQKVGAVLISGNKILSKGYNQIRHCAVGKRFTTWENSVHAERDCCRKVNKNKLKGSYIFVYRELANGKPALAKPCNDCMNMIRTMGIKRVYYSKSKFPYYGEIRL